MVNDGPHEQEIIAEIGGSVDESGICIAVYGHDLDPEDVTSRLGCNPTHSHRRGDIYQPGSQPFEGGAWLLEERGHAPTEPEQLVRRLLMRLPADKTVW
jgi:hypothetical protein